MRQRTGSGKYEKLLARCKSLEPIPTAVAHPCEPSALSGACEAAEKGLIVPILVGPAEKIAAIAKASKSTSASFEIVDCPHSEASAAKAVELVRAGEAELLMKGSLHTDELMACCCLPRPGSAHRTPHQPCVRHGRSHLSQGSDRDRRRNQHRSRSRRQGRYMPERHRSRDLSRS